MASQKKKNQKKSTTSKLRIRVQAYDPRTLDSSVRQIVDTALRLQVSIIGPTPLPTDVKKYSVNRAPFAFKTSQEQFEMRIHTRLLDIENPSSQVIEALSNLSLSSGVSVEAQLLS